MKALIAVLAFLGTAPLAQAQCFDAYGRQRICPNTPAGFQRGIVNVQRNYSSARIEEGYRDIRRLDLLPANGKIRLEFWQAEPPDEIIIEGRTWRRVR